jgi:hypothetical protein
VPDALVDIELVSGLGLPYEAGAETALAPGDTAALAAVSAVAGVALTLVPAFKLPLDEIADFLAAARQGGAEPPDLFAWYSVSCPAEVADAVVAALQALPFVVQASVRLNAVPAGWQVTSDPDTVFQRYLRRAIAGVDAFAAWQVPGGNGLGVRVADVEHSWDLGHPDLQPAAVTVLHPFAATDTAHGTGCLGVVGARSTGVGVTGVAPAAALAVSPQPDDTPSAIARAARHVGRGGVVLLELAAPINPGNHPDAPLELDVLDRVAITAASALGVLVVEPAGNAAINFDTDPRCLTLRAFSPPGIDSGALIVAAGHRQLDADGEPTGETMAADLTSGGQRVNCFAPGVGVTVPGTGAGGALVTSFTGTSPATAIVAGVAAALQGIAMASSVGTLAGSDLRARLADPQYGRFPGVTSPVNPVAIGVMPDLEKLVEGLGVPRLPPATAIRHGQGRVVLMRPRRGDVDHIDILEWREATGSWAWSLTTGTNPGTTANGHPIALHARPHPAGPAVDAICPAQTGVVTHRPFLLDLGLGVNEPGRQLTDPSGEPEAFRLTAPFTAVASADRLLVSGLSVDGTSKIFIAERKPASLDVFPMTPPTGVPGPHEPTFVTLDPFVRFNATPVIYDADGSIVLLGVDTTGTIWFASWTLDAGWSALTSVASGFDSAEAAAVVHDGPALHIVGVDPSTRELREIVRSADADGLFQWSAMRTIAQPPLVTWGVPIDPAGGLAAATDGAGTLIAIGLTAAGLPVATERRAGLDWSPLFFVPTLTPFAARAGVTIASPTAGVFLAFASDARGALYAARWTVIGWTPFAPV